MLSGNTGRGGRGGGRKALEKEKIEMSACDVSSEDFKKTWLALKELHDKELRRLQGKLNSMRKERLADGRWTGSIAKIKKLTEQQQLLNETIANLREQLSAKVCGRCTVNESYRTKLQQEFYDIQQQNLKFISELTEERDRLREENQKLSATLKSSQHLRPSSSDSEDFVPCTQKTPPARRSKELQQATQAYVPSQTPKQSQAEILKAKGRKICPKYARVTLSSQDIFQIPETLYEKSLCRDGKPTVGGSGDQKPPAAPVSATSTLGAPKGQGFQGDSTLSENKLGQPQRKQILTQKASSQKCDNRMDLSCSLPSSSTAGNPSTTQALPKMSAQNVSDYSRGPFPCFARRREKLPSNVFPMDYTLRSKGMIRSSGMTRYSSSVEDSTSLTLSTEKSTVKEETSNVPSSAGYSADKSQEDTQSFTLGSTIKRKTRVKSGRWGK